MTTGDDDFGLVVEQMRLAFPAIFKAFQHFDVETIVEKLEANDLDEVAASKELGRMKRSRVIESKPSRLKPVPLKANARFDIPSIAIAECEKFLIPGEAGIDDGEISAGVKHCRILDEFTVYDLSSNNRVVPLEFIEEENVELRVAGV